MVVVSCSSGRLILPSDILDRWIDKTRKRLEMDPNYFFKK